MSDYFLDNTKKDITGAFIMKDEFSQQYVEEEFTLKCDSLKHFVSDDNRKKGFHEDDEFIYQIAEMVADPITRYRMLDIWERNRKLARIALMHSELSEAVEGVRKNAMDDHLPDYTMETVEMADTIIRILDHCGKYLLPVGKAIKEKLEYNRSRPYKHGKQV